MLIKKSYIMDFENINFLLILEETGMIFFFFFFCMGIIIMYKDRKEGLVIEY